MKNYPINEIYGTDLYSSGVFISSVISVMFGFIIYVFFNIPILPTLASSTIVGLSLSYVIIYKVNSLVEEQDNKI